MELANPAMPTESLKERTAPTLEVAPREAVRSLGYRPWAAQFVSPHRSIWPIARVSLTMMFRQKIFWALYVLALFNFIVFFAGIYIFAQIDLEALTKNSGKGLITQNQLKTWTDMKTTLQKQLMLAGNAETFRNFFWFQGYFVVAVLALAGATLIGNDYRHGSLPFYLSKPVTRWHYLAGKCLTVGVFINLLTTVPALVLFAECAMLDDNYLQQNPQVIWGILGYGAILTVPLSLLIVALASWLRRTPALIMVWLGLLLFARILGNILVDTLHYSPSWRLVNFWNVLYILGAKCFGVGADLGNAGRRLAGPAPPRLQPEAWQALIVVSVVVVACLIYLQRRIRAVEIVN